MSLPEWPECAITETNLWALLDYERARYLAAMARLRVAVEALQETADDCVECDGSGVFSGPVGPDEDCLACAPARVAICTIGDLPPAELSAAASAASSAEQQPGRGET